MNNPTVKIDVIECPAIKEIREQLGLLVTRTYFTMRNQGKGSILQCEETALAYLHQLLDEHR